MLIRPFLLIALFKSSIPLLIFCLLVLSFIERGVLKSHTCEFFLLENLSFISCILKFGYLMNWPFYQYDWYSVSGKIQFSSVTQSCPTLCDPMDCITPGFPVHHQLLELTQTHVHQVSDAIQPSHPLLSPSPLTFNLSQHNGLFQLVSSSHQAGKILELQL